jgi:Suppressor of fused protein (SUFU)
MDEWQEWFERVWTYREETLYPSLFGTQSDGGTYVLTFELFRDRFGQATVDPRWLHHGVLVYPPTQFTETWRFATSGLSNAWEADFPDPDGSSGLGVEFLLETPQRFDWCISVTANILAYQLLLASGRLGEARIVEPYARIPLNGPIDGAMSAITYLVALPSPVAREDIQLESGRFSLLHLVGATQAEIEYARQNDSEELVERLKSAGAYPVTDPLRASIL